MRNRFLLAGCILLSNFLNAQSLRKPVAAPYIGLGAYSTHHSDVFSITANQASLASLKNISAGVYGEKRFLLNEINNYSAIIAVPTGQGNFAFQADYSGFSNFRETQLGLAYARSLGNNLDVGVKFNYYSFTIPTYQTSSAVNFEIGLIVHLTDKVHAGIHVYNPVGGHISKTDKEKLGAAYKFGLGYEAGKNFMISAEIIKEENIPVNVNAGVQYNFVKQFFARMGISSERGSPFAGAGISWNNLRLDLSASWHPQLGLSPGLMLIYNFNSPAIEKDPL